MNSKKSQKKNFNGMSYREIQCANSYDRAKLTKEEQKWLKANGFKNVGWESVIQLYQKIEELLEKDRLEELSLEELFLEADKVGNKYQSRQEIEDFNQKLATELFEVENEIDKHFPDTEMEVIDFNTNIQDKTKRNKNQKSYRTTKV